MPPGAHRGAAHARAIRVPPGAALWTVRSDLDRAARRRPCGGV